MNAYTLKSLLRWLSNVAYAVPSLCRDAVMRLTYVPFGTPFILSATFFQVLPPSRETCTLPSSVPTHRRSLFIGDSLTVVAAGHACTPSWRDSVNLSGTFPMIGSLSRSWPLVRSLPRRVQLSP